MNEYTERLKKIEAELERWLPSSQSQVCETSYQSQGCEWYDAWREKLFPGVGERVNTESVSILLEPLRDILSRGGKRWRPLLMTLVCESLGGGDAAIPLSPLVEFPHNASLIHDDIEDDSEERRGKPAVHKIYGVDTAINAGSFFYFLSTCCIESAVKEKEIKNEEQIYKLWSESLRRLHLGQAMDISWHRSISDVPSIEEYFLMCGMKTGSLARLAAELGSFTALSRKLPELGDAAEKLGIGFQILDDIKNLTTGNPGKKRGDDIAEGKKSLPILLYLHKYPEKRDWVFWCFHEAKRNGIAAPEVEELIEAITSSGILTEAEEKGRALINDARTAFGSNALFDSFFSLIS